MGVDATITLLKKLGYDLELIQSGCCGMAGSFGYESEHFDLSMKIGELTLFPKIRQMEENVALIACGVSCRSQIETGTGLKANHWIELLSLN